LTHDPLQLLKGVGICEELSGQSPHLLGSLLQCTGGFALEHVQSRQEIVGTSAVLQTGYQLQEDPIDPVGNATLVPLKVPRMFLAFVEQQVLQVVRTDGIAW